jgi:hypothetical protein
MGVNGYKKGGRAERTIYKKLGNFYFDNPKTFSRLRQEGQNYRAGDIGIFLHENEEATWKLLPLFPFCIEVKYRESWSYKKLVTKWENSEWYDYWQQAKNQSARTKNYPLLIYKKNYHKWMAAMRADDLLEGDERISSYKIPDRHLLVNINNECIAIFNFDKFLEINDNTENVVNLRKKYKELME